MRRFRFAKNSLRLHNESDQKLFAFFFLAFLICDTAARFASGLTGRLAFAASALFCALAEIAGL